MSDIKRVSHCSHWGAYTILVDGNTIVGIEPFADDPAPSPIIHSVKDWADPTRRIARPMVRSGWLEKREASDRSGRGREKFVPVSWDEALTLVAGEIDRVRTNFGNASIFAGSYGWTSCGRFHHAPSLLKRTLNLVGGFTGHVDTYSVAAGPVILRHVLGNALASDGQSNTLDSIAENTETLVIFGALSPRTAQNEAGGLGRHSLEGYLRRLVERKVRIILVSPLRDDLPDWVEVEWWPIRPNTDTALMLALAREVVKAGQHDQDFLRRCCSGSEEFLAYLAGQPDGVDKDAAWAETIVEIDAERIRSLAHALVTTRSMLTVSWSLQRADHGEQPFWAALGLAAVTGQIGLPGGGVGYGYGSLGGVGAPFGIGKSPAMSQLNKPINSFIPVARITDLLLNPGGAFEYEGQSYTYPDARMVYWAGGNPFHHHQDLNRLADAWTRPETIVVQDPMWTATAQRADIVLPATTSIERHDIAGNKRSDFLVAMHKAIEPVGEARSDFDIFNGLAEKLGVAAGFNEGRDEMGWIRHLYEASRTDARDRLDVQLPDFETFWRDGSARVQTQKNYTYLADFRVNPDEHRLATESGRIVLTSTKLTGLGYDDCLGHPAWLPPAEWLGSETVEDDQLHLISHQPTGRLHSQLEAAPASRLYKRNGREQVRVNAAAAARLGVVDGQTVRLWNERGQCLATLAISNDVRDRVAVLPTGSWFTPAAENGGLELSGNPNVLTLDKPTSQFGQGCSAHTCLIRIEPYAGETPDADQNYLNNIATLIGA